MIAASAWRCTTCGSDAFAPAIDLPDTCLRCAPARRAATFGWRPAPFGRLRKASPTEGRRWDRDDAQLRQAEIDRLLARLQLIQARLAALAGAHE